jgi:2-amino-4-hydroxy-6-hydroxymethyldihydropteridine diphosphokinase
LKFEFSGGAATTVYLSVGSNMGEKRRHCEKGLALVAANEALVMGRISPYYRTAPVDFTDQDWFVNAVAEAQTTLEPPALLDALQQVEHALGRRRNGTRFGPRVLDLDILFFGARVIALPGLQVPHPRLHKRRFVLQPMCDINDSFMHPVLHRSVRALLECLGEDGQEVQRLS